MLSTLAWPALQASAPGTTITMCGAARCGAVPPHSVFTPTTRCRATATCSSSRTKRQHKHKQRGVGQALWKEEMGASSVRCYSSSSPSSMLTLLLCSLLLHSSQASKLREEKVPLSFIVPDPSPVLSPLSAPPPVTGADDDDGMRPRLPTERWKRGRGEERRARGGAHAPAPAPWSAGPARAPAPSYAPAPDSGSGAPVIESSPAVPVPRGVRDTATILPMPAPGVKRQDVGGAALVRPGMVPLVVGLVMMASLGDLC